MCVCVCVCVRARARADVQAEDSTSRTARDASKDFFVDVQMDAFERCDNTASYWPYLHAQT